MWNSILKRLNASDSIVSLGLGLAVILVLGMLVKNYMTSRTAEQTAKQEQAQQDGKESLPLNHTVAAGDTLWSIAVKYYNNGYNWIEIQKANKLADAGAIETGQELVIPAISPTSAPVTENSKESNILSATTETSTPSPVSTGSPAPTDTASPTAVGKNYTVVHGDTLWAIAIREYNNGYRWVDIARANKLEHPDLIFAGNVLALP